MSRFPQNGEEAAYVSFVLVDALIEALVAKSTLTRNEALSIFRDAITRLDESAILVEHSTKGSRKRAADFIRDAMLVEQRDEGSLVKRTD
jgi:hypothetical protein